MNNKQKIVEFGNRLDAFRGAFKEAEKEFAETFTQPLETYSTRVKDAEYELRTALDTASKTFDIGKGETRVIDVKLYSKVSNYAKEVEFVRVRWNKFYFRKFGHKNFSTFKGTDSLRSFRARVKDEFLETLPKSMSDKLGLLFSYHDALKQLSEPSDIDYEIEIKLSSDDDGSIVEIESDYDISLRRESDMFVPFEFDFKEGALKLLAVTDFKKDFERLKARHMKSMQTTIKRLEDLKEKVFEEFPEAIVASV